MIKKTKLYTIYILAIGVLLLINFLVSSYSLRFDFSYGGAYTLSASTKKIVKNLNDIITVKFFVSSDLPTRLIPLKNAVVDLLNEYQKENQGKISVKVIDPKTDTAALKEVQDLGIPALQFSQLEQDKYAVTSSYMGIAISYGGKNEILPQVTDVNSLEYNLTAAIYKLTNKVPVKIGVIGPSDQMTELDKVLQQQFTVDYLDISSQSAVKTIGPTYKTVIVIDNKSGLDATAVQALQSYLDNKGKVIFFHDGVQVGDNLTASVAINNLADLFDRYGIKINPDLVLSGNAEIVNFGNSQTSFLVPYPFWIKTNVFNSQTPYFSNINQLMLPWSSAITLEKKSGVETIELVKTDAKSWEQTGNFVLDPQAVPQPQPKDLKQFIVAVEAKKTGQGKMAVVTSSRFPLDQYQSQLSDNISFVLNIANNFASGGALAGIRQRAVSFYPLPNMSTSNQDIFRYANIFVLPVLFALYGAWRLIRRK